MSFPSIASVGNRLLCSLTRDDFALLAPELRQRKTTLREVLIQPNERVRDVHFPECGFISITYNEVEVGLIGREGFVGGMPALLGGASSPYTHVVQMPGETLSIDTETLRTLVSQSSTLSCALLRFVRAYLIQTTHTAYANVSLGNEARLARWLLMCHDRVEGDEIRTTHEFLAQMLGMPRTGVTMALQTLQIEQVVHIQRGSIIILDRARLLAIAGNGYGVAEAFYETLIGAA